MVTERRVQKGSTRSSEKKVSFHYHFSPSGSCLGMTRARNQGTANIDLLFDKMSSATLPFDLKIPALSCQPIVDGLKAIYRYLGGLARLQWNSNPRTRDGHCTGRNPIRSGDWKVSLSSKATDRFTLILPSRVLALPSADGVTWPLFGVQPILITKSHNHNQQIYKAISGWHQNIQFKSEIQA